MNCIACSGKLHIESIEGLFSKKPVQIKRCEECSGIHFQGYRGDAHDILHLSNFQNVAVGREIYFDFDILGSRDIDPQRIHGWFDEVTRTPVQFG